ncbi:dihydroorotate dehydrogenase electron transfer subunit [Brucepastera parasyntrophica]|uniref:iron-sulfur cluster-binding protein n=1 Tax=Brucepastera parasyntrophica TaxID=2880008 RepID=UPI00210EC282|nr:dihydroorotate dehydrogenase electron transfer subunit [Brucepastera parasyntrophica]ULQ60808.1 dihydroorotate dehydrogenase electron transfer subunit [Brucepastera parasyntrophica]
MKCPSSIPRIACSARVRANREIEQSVFELVIERKITAYETGPETGPAEKTVSIPAPCPGQFFMLRARPSGVLLGRPISIFKSDKTTLTFLILKKGAGTEELCSLRKGDHVDILGPVGNHFMQPDELFSEERKKELVAGKNDGLLASAISYLLETMQAGETGPLRIAIAGGGIGIAPVAGFAQTLPPSSFDFYACFRSDPYGIEDIANRAKNLYITTEDGSAGTRGILSDIFDPSKYDLVYACGPVPMLKYIQNCCPGHKPFAFLSLEQRMACGAGACLGCTVKTIHGNRRCCVDGPVFNAAEVIL